MLLASFSNKNYRTNFIYAVPTHGPLKLRTVHLSNNTIIYESRFHNVFSDLKALLCQDHTQNFRSIAHERLAQAKLLDGNVSLFLLHGIYTRFQGFHAGDNCQRDFCRLAV
jgi:hypothetical protein